MRIFLIIFLAVLIASQTKAFEEILMKDFNYALAKNQNENIKKLLESFREILKNGNNTLGIPSLDPFKVDQKNLSLNWEDMKGNVKFDSVGVSGVSNYNVVKADFKIVGLKLSIVLQWPNLEGNITNYDINSRFMDFVNVLGNGNAHFTVKDLKFSTVVAVGRNSTTKKFYVKNMNTVISLPSYGLEFYTKDLYQDRDISELISAVISELAPDAVQNYQKDLTDPLNVLMMDAINKFIGNINLLGRDN